ncbi:hypothetical protein [Candidatus Poriferisodalis sp.]
MPRNRYDSAGNLRPLHQRSPGVWWTAVLVVAAMLLTGFAAIASVL